MPPATPTPTSTSISGANGTAPILPIGETNEEPGAAGPGVYLTADGQTDTYELLSSILGEKPFEVPDCGHPEFGPHITQDWDSDLEKPVFVFHIHVETDDDRCRSFDRQRNEIKAYSSSPENVKGFLGETITYRWRFKLDGGFQPSPNFGNIHQLKDVGGDIGLPLIALMPRSGSPDQLEFAHNDSNGGRYIVATTPLDPFRGVWVEAYEKMTYGHHGSYSIELRDLSTRALLFAYDDPEIDLWRIGAEFVRPKWGIYRSLNSKEYLRDEQVRFDQFCLAKGNDDCPPLGPTGAGVRR